MGQESGRGLTETAASGPLTGCRKVASRAVETSRLGWGRLALKLTHVVADRIQSLTGCWTEGPSSSVAVDGKSPFVS